MKKNMGISDRTIRMIIALALVAVLSFSSLLTGTLMYIAWIVAGVFILTSLFGVCPLYSLFGISTCPVGKRGRTH